MAVSPTGSAPTAAVIRGGGGEARVGLEGMAEGPLGGF